MSSAVRRRVREKGSHRLEEPVDAAPTPGHGLYDTIGPLAGRSLAVVLLVIGSPVIFLAALAMRLTSRGPAIFRQTRVGRHGRTYVMYKIRTMRVDAEKHTGPTWTKLRDPRITPLGRLIRKLHLDEFPQLINVIKGEMALVGPRPERPEFTQRLAIEIPGYLDRLEVLPGITGLAQINLPPDTDLDSVRRKLVLDLLYARECGAWLDAKIMACTFARLFCIKGPRVTRLFGVERTVQLDDSDTNVDLLATDLVMPEADVVDGAHVILVSKNGQPQKTNGHKTNGHAGPWSQELPRSRRRPR